jgi:hypothetical protein
MSDIPLVVPIGVPFAEQLEARMSSSERPAVSGRSLVARLLSPRDLAVLSTVRLFRQVSSHQLRRLHFTNLTPESQKRVTSRVLRRLVKWGELGRIDQAKGGWNGGSTGYIYIPAESKARIPDPHTLDIAELLTRLVECQRGGAIRLRSFAPEPYCHETLGTIELKPDARVQIRTATNEYAWFLEVDRGTEWRSALGKKMGGYVNAYERWPKRSFPGVLFTVPDKERKRFVESVAKRQEVPKLFTVVTFDEAVSLLTT